MKELMESFCEIVWQDVKINKSYENLIEKVLQKCFEVENINPTSFCIYVTLTNPENIRKINNKFRKVDNPTDVLSFPMFEKAELDEILKNNKAKLQKLKFEEKSCEQKMEESQKIEPQETLGDIIISLQKVEEQAKEYGHSFERELAYMVVHGFYHLRGYDHMEEEEKKQMRKKEENVLEKLSITR